MKIEHLRQSGNNIVFLEKNNCKDYVIIPPVMCVHAVVATADIQYLAYALTGGPYHLTPNICKHIQ